MSTILSTDELRQLLDSRAARVNTPSFIQADPVQFPHRYSDPRDIEIASLLASTIAWGRRDMICRNCNRIFTDIMHDSPYGYMAEGEFESLPARMNIHRTFFSDNLRYYLRGLREVYATHGSLAAFARSNDIASEPYPSFAFAAALGRALAAANDGATDSRCLPTNLSTTPLKRLNMALRWLVRDDGIVDMGIWDRSVMSPSQLVIPLDVHVGRAARSLGLTSRANDDRRTALEITDALRRINPSDPILYDFALFDLSMSGEHLLLGDC